jgi:hypothetical protein
MNKLIAFSIIAVFFALLTTCNSVVLADRDDDDDDDDNDRDYDSDDKSSKILCQAGLPLLGMFLGDPTGLVGGAAAKIIC